MIGCPASSSMPAPVRLPGLCPRCARRVPERAARSAQRIDGLGVACSVKNRARMVTQVTKKQHLSTGIATAPAGARAPVPIATPHRPDTVAHDGPRRPPVFVEPRSEVPATTPRGLDKALRLQRLALERPVARLEPAELAFAKEVIGAAEKDPKLAGAAGRARVALGGGDHVALAEALQELEAGGGKELAAQARVLRAQASFAAEVSRAAGACSFPPTETELRTYFRTFRGSVDSSAALRAYERYASAFYLDAFADRAELPADKFWVDVEYSKPHASAWMYQSLWTKDRCEALNPSTWIETTEPTSWSQVTSERELIGGRRLIDCEGFAFLGGALLREAYPTSDYDLRYVTAYEESVGIGHAMAELIPKKQALSPILVTGKSVLTTSDIRPEARAKYRKMGDEFTPVQTKDAYALLFKAYSATAYYAGDSLSEATAGQASKHGRIRNPFVLIDLGEEPLPICPR